MCSAANASDSNQTFNSSALVVLTFKAIFKNHNLIIDQLPFKSIDSSLLLNSSLDYNNINFIYMIRNWRIPEDIVKRDILPRSKQYLLDPFGMLFPNCDNIYKKENHFIAEYIEYVGGEPDDSWQDDPYEMYQIV